MPLRIDKSLRRKIGENIIKTRKDRDMSPTQLAKALGISSDLMFKYESGDRPLNPEILMGIVKNLGISLDNLFEISPDVVLSEVQGIGVEFSPWDSFGSKPFEEENKYLEQEKNCSCQRLVVPFLYASFQTDEVVMSYWSRMYKYLYDDDFVRKDELIKGRELRRKELYDGQRTVYQISSEMEIIRFARGEPPHENLTAEARVEQLQHLIKILSSYPLRIYFGMTKVPLIANYSIYDDVMACMEYHYNYVDIRETQIVKGMLDDFTGLWKNSIRGIEVTDFLWRQIKEIGQYS